MTESMQVWGEQVARSLKIGYPDQALLFHLEELLSWHRRILKDGVTEYDQEILGDISVQEFGILFENLIDRLLFQGMGDGERLFPNNTNLRAAKDRYRKLMKLFHPDTGANSEEWLNFRAERVNSLYAEFKKTENSDAAREYSEASSGLKRVKRARVKSSGGYKEGRTVSVNNSKARRRKSSRSKLQKKFGDPADLEKRIMLLAKVCVVSTLILIVVVSYTLA